MLTIGYLAFMDVPMHTEAIIVISKAFAVLDLGFGKTKLIVTNQKIHAKLLHTPCILLKHLVNSTI